MKFNILNIQINKNKSIFEALQKLNKIEDVSRLILFVTHDNGSVLGSLTDGDIRRSLSNEGDVMKKVEDICFRNFVFEYDKKEFLNLKSYRKKDIKILPILDKDNRLLGIIDLEKTKSILPLECVIMAGGRGKRLSPLTDSVPKPMLLLGDKPIIEHNIDRLISFGIKKIYISVKYLGEQIESYFGDGSSKGIQIEYIWEDEPLGTAGALSLVNDFKTDHILLMNSDLFTNVDFEEMYLKLISKNADMVIASTEFKVDVPFAIFDTENSKVKGFEEKPSYAYYSNAGIYIFKKEVLDIIPKNKFIDITDVMDKLLAQGSDLIHNPLIGYWIDIGNPKDYKNAQESLKHFDS